MKRESLDRVISWDQVRGASDHGERVQSTENLFDRPYVKALKERMARECKEQGPCRERTWLDMAIKTAPRRGLVCEICGKGIKFKAPCRVWPRRRTIPGGKLRWFSTFAHPTCADREPFLLYTRSQVKKIAPWQKIKLRSLDVCCICRYFCCLFWQ